jgi:hypothetical protein
MKKNGYRRSCVALTQRVVRATSVFIHSFVPSVVATTHDDEESVDVRADDNVRDDGGERDDADDIVGITHRTTNGNGKWRFG